MDVDVSRRSLDKLDVLKMSSLQPPPSSSSATSESAGPALPQELVGGGRFQVKEKIGGGTFGDIYLAVDSMNGQDVAMKRESFMTRPAQLRGEYKLYKNIEGGPGVPRIRWFGTEEDSHWLAMDLLGPSIQDLFNLCGRSFTMKTQLMLADGMLSRIEYLHLKKHIHRDVKPDNFVMGIGPTKDTLYLIDLGLTRRFYDAKINLHIPQRANMSIIGTVRYASVFTHRGLEQSRRDDLEQLAYTLIYLNQGVLPWQGVVADTKKQKEDKISELKLSISAETVCEGCPEEFLQFLNYCRNLKFDEAPNYNFVRSLFRNLLNRLGHQFDYKFDWKTLEQIQDTRAHIIKYFNCLGIKGPSPVAD